MLDALLSLVGGGNSTLVAIIVGVFGVLGTFIMGRRSGKASAEAKQAKSELKARDTADEIDDAVAGRSASENRGRLGTWGSK